MAEVAQWSDCVAITGLGMVTPVGLSCAASAAAMRAGISRIGELPWFEIEGGDGEPVPVTGAEVPEIPAGRWGLSRLLRLAEPALTEAVADAGLKYETVCTVYLGTAVKHPGGRALEVGASLQRELSTSLAKVIRSAQIRLVEAGRAAALQALRLAAMEMQNSGRDIAIVGGVDSWVSPRSLMFLQDTKRLREGRRSTGILPGEAAGFVVLEKIEHARQRGARTKANLLAAAGAHEATPLDKPCRAEALSAVFRAVDSHIEAPAPLVVSDFTGERHRANEWMFAGTRGIGPYREDLRHWHAAEYIGDSGAASGAVATAWAATALQKGYARAHHVMIWGASDEGAREAALIGLTGGNA